MSELKLKQIAQEVGGESYSEIWLSPNKQITKLYSERYIETEYCRNDIQNDIATLLTLSKCNYDFGSRYAVPKKLLARGSKVIGYVMPYIEGTPLSQTKALTAPRFKEIICRLYEDILYVNNETRFSFADMHEDNIMIGGDSQIYHIDLDGWYNGDGKGRRSRYIAMQADKLLSLPGKYSLEPSGSIVPDINSDLFCLIHIVLNGLLHSDIYFARMPENEQKRYLQYISERCNGERIASMYSDLFSEEENRFDLEAISRLPDDLSVFAYDTFINKTSKFKTDVDAEEFLRQNELRLNKLFPNRNL